MFLLVTGVDRVFIIHIESDMKSKVFKKPFFTFTWVILLGGMGDMVKVPHADRAVSFGNRHSKTSTPKGF